MKLILVKDYQEMSKQAAEYVIEKLLQNPNMKLGLATGGTPIGTYKFLIEDHKRNGTSYQNVKSFNLDEYVGLSATNENSYRYYMDDVFFNHIDIKKKNVHIPSGDAPDIQKECEDYEKVLTKHGRVDLQILGIGNNGHIGFNEPGTSFDSKTHIVNLASSTIRANSRYFESMEEVPTRAVTMGIATIMQSKEILLLVSGESKSKALLKLWENEVDEYFPASVLKKHPAVTVIADEAAYVEWKANNRAFA